MLKLHPRVDSIHLRRHPCHPRLRTPLHAPPQEQLKLQKLRGVSRSTTFFKRERPGSVRGKIKTRKNESLVVGSLGEVTCHFRLWSCHESAPTAPTGTPPKAFENKPVELDPKRMAWRHGGSDSLKNMVKSPSGCCDWSSRCPGSEARALKGAPKVVPLSPSWPMRSNPWGERTL